MKIEKKVLAIFLIILGASIAVSIIGSYYVFGALTTKESKTWTEEFNIEDCTFSSTGNNTYFILEIGYYLILEGVEGSDNIKLNITVLNETEWIDGIETRVVQENESINGEVIEISRNYFAICIQTKDIFYFGEQVDIYKNGIIVSHEGQWNASEPDNKPGIIMPGSPLIGARYYQEIAPGIAMDRAEIIDNNAIIIIPLDTFERCLVVKETTPVEPGALEYKYFAPGIGLIIDETLKLTDKGFI